MYYKVGDIITNGEMYLLIEEDTSFYYVYREINKAKQWSVDKKYLSLNPNWIKVTGWQ